MRCMTRTTVTAFGLALALGGAAPALAAEETEGTGIDLLPDEVMRDAERAMEADTDLLVKDRAIGTTGDDAELFEGDELGINVGDEGDAPREKSSEPETAETPPSPVTQPTREGGDDS